MQQQVPAFETITTAGDSVPWITMIHGVSQTRQLFSAQVEAFKDDYQLLLVDLPGHGDSTEISGPYGLVEFAAAIALALDAVGVEESHFWGTHLGAGAGLLLAASDPKRFCSMILEGPVFPGRSLPAVASILDKVRAVARDLGMAQARKVWFDESEWFTVMRQYPQECRADEQWQIISKFQGAPWLDAGLVSSIDNIDDQLAALTTPTLIINGEHDLADFLEVAELLDNVLPNCQRASIIGGGGFPLWEFPERVNPVVSEFIRQR
jgi:pimeloyl-ACP methyl ester carboxylesterase